MRRHSAVLLLLLFIAPLFFLLSIEVGLNGAAYADDERELLSRAAALEIGQSYDLAIEAYRDVIAHYPRNAAAHNDLGRLLMATGKLQEAEDAYMEAFRIDGNYFRAFINLGALYTQWGRYDDALDHLLRAQAVDKDSPYVLSGLGILEVRRGHYAEAEKLFQKTLEVQPDFPGAQQNLRSVRALLNQNQI